MTTPTKFGFTSNGPGVNQRTRHGRNICTAPVTFNAPRTAEAIAGDLQLDELSWQENALCAEVDGELFFPEKGCSAREAKSICRRCEVQDECLDYALREGLDHGVWGGTSERERRLLKRGAA